MRFLKKLRFVLRAKRLVRAVHSHLMRQARILVEPTWNPSFP